MGWSNRRRRRRQLRDADGTDIDVHEYVRRRELSIREGRRHLDGVPTFEGSTEMLVCPELEQASVLALGCKIAKAECFEMVVDIWETVWRGGYYCSSFGSYGSYQGSAACGYGSDCGSSSYADLECPPALLAYGAQSCSFPSSRGLITSWGTCASAWASSSRGSGRQLAEVEEASKATGEEADKDLTSARRRMFFDGGYTTAADGSCDDTCVWANDGSCDHESAASSLDSVCPDGTDCSDCLVGGSSWLSSWTTNGLGPSPPASSACSNVCNSAFNGQCDDGGPGAEYAMCSYGSDCRDCGERAIMPPPPSPSPPLSCNTPCGDDGMTCGLLQETRTCSQLNEMGCSCNGCCSSSLSSVTAENANNDYSYEAGTEPSETAVDDQEVDNDVNGTLCAKSLWNAYTSVINGPTYAAFMSVAWDTCDNWDNRRRSLLDGRLLSDEPSGEVASPAAGRELSEYTGTACEVQFMRNQAREAFTELLAAYFFDDNDPADSMNINSNQAIFEGVATVMDWYRDCLNNCYQRPDGSVGPPGSPPPPSPSPSPPPRPRPPPPPPSPSPPPLAASDCTETCRYASDGDCDDGGPGAEYTLCSLGTDCTDCGTRVSVLSSGLSSRAAARARANAFRRAGPPRPRSWRTWMTWWRQLQAMERGF